MTLEKVLKRGKHNNAIRTASLVSVLDSETSFSLFFLNGLRLRSVAWLATPASSAVVRDLPWLPWRRHWLRILEVGHHNCWNRQPTNRTEREKTIKNVWFFFFSNSHWNVMSWTDFYLKLRNFPEKHWRMTSTPQSRNVVCKMNQNHFLKIFCRLKKLNMTQNSGPVLVCFVLIKYIKLT